MKRLIVLHSNDIHGRVDALARVATVVERARADAGDAAVLYVDAGDVEDRTGRLSNLTKGVALHRLLRVAGCQAVAVGNGSVIYYGVEPLVDQAAAGGYPHLAANLWRDGALVPGVEARVLLDVDGIRVGLIGLTPTNWRELYEKAFGVDLPDEVPLVREHADVLWAEGADVVFVLSHLGLDRDRDISAELDGEITLVIGSHSHTLLLEGEQVGRVTIVQAGEFGTYLGRVELAVAPDGARVVTAVAEPVPDDTPLHPGVMAEVETIERELEAWLAETISEVTATLDHSAVRECSGVAFVADVVRERMGADVAVVTPAVTLVAPLPAGPLKRGVLYEACPSPAVSSVTTMTGAQLLDLVRRGLDPEFATERTRSTRGEARGLIHLSGAEIRDGTLLVAGGPVEPDRHYRVAGTDWELENYGGYAKPEWELEIAFDGTTIVREAIEDHLRLHPRVEPPAPRIHGSLRDD